MDGASEIGAALGPMPAYRALLASGALSTDPAQALAAERLHALWVRLQGYAPSVRKAERGLWDRIRHRAVADDIPPSYPHGLYMVGAVGRGKSMLMDLFFDQATVARKRRVHFHQFMQEVHARIHAWRRAPHRLADPHSDDPIPPLADEIAAEAWLLCFDEFQINDIADAMILGRLFKALFARGVVVVATSNTTPDALFAGQPGRDAFLPFIVLIQTYLDLIVLDGDRDWRRQRLRQMPTWVIGMDAAADAAMDAAFRELSGGAAARPTRLTVMGRRLEVPLAAGGVARFDFASLCEQPLGAGDYLALAGHFHALVLDGVRRLGPGNHDAARRFITLIDALYDHRVKLVASAEAAPDVLYRAGRGADAFERTASRLVEMQSADYLALPHLT